LTDILTIIRAEDGVASYSSPAVKSDLGFEPQLFMCGEKFDRELVHPDGNELNFLGIEMFG
jgi:hypothetical protein